MSTKAWLRAGATGLIVALSGLAGCEGSGGGAPLPDTGGAGIPGVRGPVSSKMPKRAAGKASPAQEKEADSPKAETPPGS